MPEIKDSSPQIKQESLKPKIERILNITKKCLSGDITPIDAFHQIVDRNPQPAEATETTTSLPPQTKIETEQHQTNQEIEQIRQEISNITPEAKPKDPEPVFDSKESLIDKDEYYLEKEKLLFGKGFIYSHETNYQRDPYYEDSPYGKFDAYIDKIEDKYIKKKSISILKKLGVQDPQEFYKFFNERDFDVRSLISKKIRSPLLELSPGEIIKSIDRVEKLGFEIKVYGLRLDSSEFINVIKQITSIPDEKFNNFTTELNQYSFLNKGIQKNNDLFFPKRNDDGEFFWKTNPIFEKLLEHAKNGKLSPEVKNRLDLFKETILLGTSKNSELEKLNTEKLMDSISPIEYYYRGFSEIKIQKQVYKSEYGDRDYYSDMLNIFDTNSVISFKTEIYDDAIFNSDFKFIWENLDKLENGDIFFKSLSQEQIAQISNNSNGFADFLKAVDSNNCRYYGSNLISLFTENSSDFSKFLDQDGHFNHLFLESLIAKEIEINYELLSAENLASFSDQDKAKWTIYKDLYSINYGTRTNNLNTFFTENSSDFSKFLDQDNHFKSLFLESLIAKGINIPSDMLSAENLVSFLDQDKAKWTLYKDLYGSNDITNLTHFFAENSSDFSKFLDENNHFKSLLLESLITKGIIIPSNILSTENLASFSDKNKTIWTIYREILTLNGYSEKLNTFFAENSSDFSNFLDQNNHFNSFFLESLINKGINIPSNILSTENLASFSDQDKKIWTYIRENREFDKFIIENKEKFDQYIIENKFTSTFFDDLKNSYNDKFIDYFKNKASKEDWNSAFGKDTIDSLLNNLPVKTDEKRNAFTRNEYDRTTAFFNFLINHPESKFILDKENITIATEYIKSFGLSKSPIVFQYFKVILDFEKGKISELPTEYLNSGINTIDQLKIQVNNIKNLCLGSKPLENLSELTPLQLNLLSVATGHASNRWTRQPIENIIRDFSKDLKEGMIKPLSSEFSTSLIEINKINIKNNINLSDNQNFQNLKEEVLSSIKNVKEINDLKSLTEEILNKKIIELSGKDNNDFIRKQIDIFKSGMEKINKTESVDDMVGALLSLNINFGRDQDQYNSILRQLVFRKVLDKHNSPDFVEGLRISLENNPGPEAVSNSLNFLNNLVKDHALEFKNNNDEKYWNDDSFANIKKYEKVFRKNLSIGTFSKELELISSQFEIIKSDSSLNISMTPDRGLLGEMAGYMADVCYTKVYPLLKQYPNLVPYRFVSSSENNSELIGSTLVFQVETAEGEPALLIRAFDIPQEQSLDIGLFFEKFVDSLSATAKKLGVKKIIAAGTSGTISNYSLTTNYVLSNYVNGKNNTPLKNTFNFNGYDITNNCYTVRDLTEPKTP